MRKATGQAALRAGRMLHRILHVVLAVVILAGAGVAALSWRLSQGPLALPWLVRRLEAASEGFGGGTKLSVGGAALTWEGFSHGVDRPLDIRLTDIVLTTANGDRTLHIPQAEISLSLGRLLLGEIVPRAIAVDNARLRVVRAASGAIALDIAGTDQAGEPAAPPNAAAQPFAAVWPAILAELSRPSRSDLAPDSSTWSQLRRVEIRNAALSFSDRRLDMDWQASSGMIDLQRLPRGGATADADITLALGGQQAQLTVQARLQTDGRTTASARLTPFVPATIAAAAPDLARLSALAAPVSLSATADFDATLHPSALHVQARIGQGTLDTGTAVLPLVGASLQADGSLSAIDIKLLRLEIAPRPGGPHSVLQARVQARRDGTTLLASIGLDFDQVAFADLPALWPVGIGSNGLRPWIIDNLTSGTASAGHVELALRCADDFSDMQVSSIAGGLTGHDLTVYWLRPVPPIVHGEATLSFVDPDDIAIAVHSGQQDGGRNGGVAIRSGTVRFSGIVQKDQFLDIDADLAGSLADLLTVLHDPKIGLLDRRPITMRNPAGQFSGHLAIIRLPLKNNLSINDLQIRTTVHLTDVHLGGIADGRDLDGGVLDLQASNDGLQVGGTAAIAGIPAKLSVAMDFRDGPPSEVLQKVTLSASADAGQLQAIGLDVGPLMTGSAAIQADVQSRRNGGGEVSVHADLASAALAAARLDWTKPAGQPAALDLHMTLDHDRPVDIDRLRITGVGIDAQAQVDFAAGQPVRARLARLMLGKDTDLHGEIGWPQAPGGGWTVDLSGPSLDASGEFAHHEAAKRNASQPGPAWTANVHVDRLVLGPDRALSNVVLRAASDGLVIRQAQLSGRTAPGQNFTVTIAPPSGGKAPAGRRLSGSAADAGGLLRALDVTDSVHGGAVTLSGSYDDSTAEHALSGVAEITGFRVSNAPILARLLQAMTLYGLVDAMQGPGLGFDHLVAPFRLVGDTLELNNARAFSSSLGMTAKGQIVLGGGGACDVQGTIVPAYFFNSLLGDIPLVGKLFSPERGGGLFAASYSVRGNCDDPSVGVNPLAALTPGFLRGLFGIFNAPAGTPPAPGP
jgi:hypothetical protein